MRENLFCGKRKDTGEWVEGFLLKGNRTYIVTPDAVNYMVVSLCGMASVQLVEVIPETVGAYIGLTDRNGKRIFEGNIVKHHRELWGKDASVFGVVFWDAEKCRFCRTSSPCPENRFVVSDDERQETPEMWASAAADYEVIGNIHDNPELFEGGAG